MSICKIFLNSTECKCKFATQCEMDDGNRWFYKSTTLFVIPKKVVLVEIPYYPKNEAYSKQFIKRFDEVTDNLDDIRIKWVTKKV